ncbi:hypothetical protein PVK06_023967 [Gossypium arboreum]|uniref:Cation/H+ exchanger transmembrane domain-containing protein n=1 Tax=Gossypium arboreum TaxID=29729 RepID=A0ABR0PCS1_GOSAR|nr:hypothetical protein PVK06_023967 [Gossypium arboreum]
MAYSSRLSSNLVLKGNFDSPMCGTYLAISFFCGLHDVSKVRGVKSHCQGSDSSPYADGNDRNAEFAESSNESSGSLGEEVINEKAQGISEAAIASRDKATNAWNHVNSKLNVMQGIANEECIAKEAIQKATTALSLAEARLQVAVDSFELLENGNGSVKSYGKSDAQMDVREDNEVILDAQYEIRECQKKLANCEVELRQVWGKKEELLKEVERLKEVAKKAQMDALEAKEDVANIMLLAEKTVAFKTFYLTKRKKGFEDHKQFFDFTNYENVMLGLDSIKEAEVEAEKSKNVQPKKSDTPKNVTTESSSLNMPKSLLNKSSRFLSTSFFSLTFDGTKLTPASVAQCFLESARKQIPKLVVRLLLFGAGVAFYANQTERSAQLLQQPDAITSNVEVSPNAKPMLHKVQNFPKRIKKIVAMLPHQEMNEEEASLFDVLWLLLARVIFVPIFQKIPGGSPVLGYLVAGILVGPYGLSIIHHVHGTKAIAEFGAVFLLFNICLELSVERLSSMKKYVFGLGSAQVIEKIDFVLLSLSVAVGLVAHFVSGQPGPAAMVIGNGLALSSTAVVLQVLQERGESTSRHGRATFSVLLFQDLAVVLLILIPLISPNSSKGEIGFRAIAESLGLAVVKAAVSITTIIADGRLFLS